MGKVLTKNLFQLSAESPISSESLDSVGITSGLRSKYVKKGLLLSLQKGVHSKTKYANPQCVDLRIDVAEIPKL